MCGRPTVSADERGISSEYLLVLEDGSGRDALDTAKKLNSLVTQRVHGLFGLANLKCECEERT